MFCYDDYGYYNFCFVVGFDFYGVWGRYYVVYGYFFFWRYDFVDDYNVYCFGIVFVLVRVEFVY